MNAKLPTQPTDWVDSDDAPDLTPEWFADARREIGGKPVTPEVAKTALAKRVGRPTVEIKRPVVSIRIDPDVLERLRASGKGWQSKVNALLRQAVEQGKV